MHKPAKHAPDNVSENAPPPEAHSSAHNTSYDLWVRDQVEIALKAKREGRATYKSIDEIAAKFSNNAG